MLMQTNYNYLQAEDKVIDQATYVRCRSRLCENLTDAMIPVLNREGMMTGFVQGADRQQRTLLPEAAWELDFWGKFRRGVESADAVCLGSID
jgi:hypothetical protein